VEESSSVIVPVILRGLEIVKNVQDFVASRRLFTQWSHVTKMTDLSVLEAHVAIRLITFVLFITYNVRSTRLATLLQLTDTFLLPILFSLR